MSSQLQIIPEESNQEDPLPSQEDLLLMLNLGNQIKQDLIKSKPNNNKSRYQEINQLNQHNIDYYNNNNINNYNNNNIIQDNEILLLQKKLNSMKSLLINFESMNCINSPYHQDIQKRLLEKSKPEKLSDEMCQKILYLYSNKFYGDCYDLWKIYAFQQLPGISSKENFEIFRKLTKIKDTFIYRDYIIKNLDKINFFTEVNGNIFPFSNDLGLKINNYNSNTNEINNNDNINNKSASSKYFYQNMNKITNQRNYEGGSNSSLNNNDSGVTSEEIFRQKSIENDSMIQNLKNKIIKSKRNSNSNYSNYNNYNFK